MKMPEKIAIRLRKEIRKCLHRHSPKCFYCRCETILPPQGRKDLKPQPNFATLDHMQPLSRNGVDHISNIILSCLKCRAEKNKHDMTAEEFMSH